MKISSAFDGGNIRVLKLEDAKSIQLEIQNDYQSKYFQWFYFRLTGAKHTACQVNIMNAGLCAYPEGFEGYSAVASYDREHWFRVSTEFDGEVMTLSLTPETDSIYFAYFAPYSMERHADLVAQCQASPRVSYQNLGLTLEGQDLDFLRIGTPGENKKKLWFMARQHPGETMAEWWMEGFLDRLLDEDDALVRELLKQASFYAIPNMNPDGSRRGHLRTNAVGVNLNRAWQNPDQKTAPEVFFVRREMEAIGVDFCLDVHGDEALPYNFICGSYGVPSWNAGLEKQLNCFLHAYVGANPDFQIDEGYPQDMPGQANLQIAKNFVAERFKCLSMTLEMPFKDTLDTPDALTGWSPERSRQLGASALNAVWAWLQDEEGLS